MTYSRSGRPLHAVILGHPREDSFNAAVAERYQAEVERIGHEVVLRDLYRIGFDPVLKAEEQATDPDYRLTADVAAEIELIGGSDVIVLVYPIWFGMPPAIIKGYVDRVLGAGLSYGALRDRLANPVASGTRLLSLTSSGNSKPWLEEQGAWLSLRAMFDDYMRRAFSLRSADHVHFPSITPGLKARFVEENLYQVRESARRMCSLVGTEHRMAVG